MKVYINEEMKEVSSDLKLNTLLHQIGMNDLSGWAIALNEQIISTIEIKDIILAEGDRLIFVQATQGG